MNESGNFERPSPAETERSPVEKQLDRRMSDIFREDGPLKGYHAYLAQHYELKPVEMGLLEAKIHDYSACLQALEQTPQNSERAEKLKARLTVAVHNLGESFIETFGEDGVAFSDQAIQGLELWKNSLNTELKEKSGTDLRIRLPGIGEQTEASWMRFEQGGKQVSGVSNWAVMEKDRVVRFAYVEA